MSYHSARRLQPTCRTDGTGILRGAPFVAVVEATDFRECDDWSDGCLRRRPVIGRVFLQAEMRSTAVIVPDVGRENAPKVGLVHDNHVVETLSSDRSRARHTDSAKDSPAPQSLRRCPFKRRGAGTPRHGCGHGPDVTSGAPSCPEKHRPAVVPTIRRWDAL
jgi:hypothetical protein